MPAQTMSTRADLQRLLLRKQAMDAGDADVGDQLDGVAHQARGNGGFFGNGQVAGAGADHADGSFAGGGVRLRERDGAGGFVILRARLSGATASKALAVARVASTLPPACAMCAKIVRHLCCGFALGKDDLGHAGAQRAVMIELGEAEIFKGQIAQAARGRPGTGVRPSLTSLSSASICRRSISAPPCDRRCDEM